MLLPGQNALTTPIVDSLDDAIVAHSRDGAITSWNRGAEVIYGYSAAETIGKSIHLVRAAGFADQAATNYERILSGERTEPYETTRVRKDGKVIWVSLTVSPIFDSAGLLVGVCSIARDITERKRVECTTREALAHARATLAELVTDLDLAQQLLTRSELACRASLHAKDLLLKESQQRVKNNLQVISSLLKLQARSLTDPRASATFSASHDRVQAIALVHDRLEQSSNFSHLDFAEHVVALVDGLFLAHGAAGRGIVRQYYLSGPPLAIDLAVPCVLIVNELISNCLKHAFCGRRSGLIQVLFQQPSAGRVELAIVDDGVGLPAGLDPHQAQSLGLHLVFTFAEQIGAAVEVDRRRGMQFRFEFAEHGVGE